MSGLRTSGNVRARTANAYPSSNFREFSNPFLLFLSILTRPLHKSVHVRIVVPVDHQFTVVRSGYARTLGPCTAANPVLFFTLFVELSLLSCEDSHSAKVTYSYGQ